MIDDTAKGSGAGMIALPARLASAELRQQMDEVIVRLNRLHHAVAESARTTRRLPKGKRAKSFADFVRVSGELLNQHQKLAEDLDRFGQAAARLHTLASLLTGAVGPVVKRRPT